jgi:hypothetical protein
MKPTLSALRLFSLVTILLATTVLQGLAESNAWDGTWRLNQARSQLSGPTFNMTISPKGEFRIVTASYSYKFYCDGKYRLVMGHRSLACLKASVSTMDVAEKDNDTLVSMVHRELSADGKSLTQTTTMINQNRRQESVKRVFVRFSKSTGLAGAWKDANALDRQPQVMVTALAGSTLRLSFPIEKQYTDVKLDGTDSLTYGTANGVRVTLSAKPQGPQMLLTVQKLNGTVVNQGMLILSSDGLSITEETWRPDAPAENTKLVYDKQ